MKYLIILTVIFLVFFNISKYINLKKKKKNLFKKHLDKFYPDKKL